METGHLGVNGVLVVPQFMGMGKVYVFALALIQSRF